MEDLEGEVAELFVVLARALEVLARVGLEELEADGGADGLEKLLLGRFDHVVASGRGAGKGIKVADEVGQIVVIGIGFEAEASLERDGVCVDEVERRQLGQEVRFAVLGVLRVSLLNVDPDVAGQVPGHLDELGPVLAAFDVAFIGAGGAERDAQTHDETEDREEQVRDDERVPELRYACYDGGPDGDEEERDEHSWRDTASHAEEVGHFSVLFNVEGFGDKVVDSAGVTAVLRPQTLVGGWRGLAEIGGLRRARVGVGSHCDGGILVGRIA